MKPDAPVSGHRQTPRDRAVYHHIWSTEKDRPPSDSFRAMVDTALAERVDGSSRVTVADLASGSGRHARWAAGRGCQVTAVEYDGTATARQLVEAGRSWAVVQADVRDWLHGQRDGTFDCLVCFDALHHMAPHLPALTSVLGGMRRVVRPGGLMLVTLLCDIRYSAGVVPPDRLNLPADAGEQFLADFFAADDVQTVKRKAVDVEQTMTTDSAGHLVPAAYSAQRVLCLVRRRLEP